LKKGKFLFLGLIGLLLMFGMAVVGCDTSDPYSPPKAGLSRFEGVCPENKNCIKE